MFFGGDAGNRFSSDVALKSLHKFVAYRLRCTTIAVSFAPAYTVISTRYSICCRGFYAKMYFASPPAPGRGVSGCVVVGKRGGWFRPGAGGGAIYT